MNKKKLRDNETIEEAYDKLKYKYERVVSENVALKLELKMYKSKLCFEILKDIKKDVTDENNKREKEIFEEQVVLDLKNALYRKNMEIEKMKKMIEKNDDDTISYNTPNFNGFDKMIDDTYKIMKMSKTLYIVQYHGIKNAINEVNLTSHKTIVALLKMTDEKMKEKGITIEEVNSFTKNYPMMHDFIKKKVDAQYSLISNSDAIGESMKELCNLINDIFGTNYISEKDVKNIVSFSNKITK